MDVLRLIAAGNANKEIAGQLSVAEETVKGHVTNIPAKLGANDRTQAVTTALKRGIIELQIPPKWDSSIPVSDVSKALRTEYSVGRSVLQRLFSTFASGWPGPGLLLLRMFTGLALIRLGISSVLEAPPLAMVLLQSIGVGAGILLLIGLWTPVAGAITAVVKILVAFLLYFSQSTRDPWSPAIQAALGAVLAMVGPALGPSMPGSSAGNVSIFQNPRRVFSPPIVLVPNRMISGTNRPTF
jgi:DNA-binding CsgD family transcriptional regulator